VLRDNLKFQEALVEFERAADIDPTNLAARQEAQKTADMIKRKPSRKRALRAPAYVYIGQNG